MASSLRVIDGVRLFGASFWPKTRLVNRIPPPRAKTAPTELIAPRRPISVARQQSCRRGHHADRAQAHLAHRGRRGSARRDILSKN